MVDFMCRWFYTFGFDLDFRWMGGGHYWMVNQLFNCKFELFVQNDNFIVMELEKR